MRRSTVFGLSVAGLIFSMVVVAAIADAFAGQTTRVSVNSDGAAANMSTSPGVLSADGRYVVFWSTATNLVAGVFTSGAHVYRHDRLTGLTVNVSVAMTGNPGNNVSRDPSISANGRYVVFTSFATDLVAGGTNGRSQVFVRDMLAGTTALVSASSSDVPGDLSSGLSGLGGAHEVSDDGQHVVFTSFATNLAAGTNNGNQQVYVKNMTTREVVRASVNDAGDAGDRTSQTPVISGDGQLVAFRSESTNFSPLSTSGIIAQVFVHHLVDRTTTLESPGAAAVMRHSTVPVLSSDGRYLAFVSEARLDPRDLDNGTPDVYLKDRDLDTTVLASLSPNAVSGAVSGGPSISGDGRWVTFTSIDEQIVSGDTNGIVADVFLYDRNSQTVTIASRNDDGVQADRPSREPSLSGDGSLVVFASSATNLVPTPFTSTTQLYLRQLADNNVAPTVNLPSPLDLVFTLTLDATGSFTDPGPAPDETHSATVNYGDDSDTLDLALDGGSFALHHTYAEAGSYTVTVIVSDSKGGSTTATMVVNVLGYTYEWLDPVGSTFIVGRNLPVKFTVHGPDGSLVADPSVQVDVIDASGAVVAGPYVFGGQPSRAVLWNGDSYHVNVDTKDLAPGMYWLRVRFSSPTLTGEFTLGTTGAAGLESATRSRVH